MKGLMKYTVCPYRLQTFFWASGSIGIIANDSTWVICEPSVFFLNIILYSIPSLQIHAVMFRDGN